MWIRRGLCQIPLTSTLVLFLAVSRMDAGLLEFHLTPASWNDARRICSDYNGALMTKHFLAFSGIRNKTWFDGSQSTWTGFYWLDTGIGNVLMDDSCQSTSSSGVDTSSLLQMTAVATSHRCVLVNYTASVTLLADECDKELPFVCEIEGHLKPSVFSKFEFSPENYQTAQTKDLATCRSLCLKTTGLTCRSLVFNPDSRECVLLSQKYTLPGGRLSMDWLPIYSHDILDTYTDKISSRSNGNIFNKSDSDAAEVRTGSNGNMCELQCAWLNQECTCADYANGKCRIFSKTSDCQASQLLPSASSAVTIIKTFGNYEVLFVRSTDDPLPIAPFSPPQLDCQVPTPTPDPDVLTSSTLPLPDDTSAPVLITQSSGFELVTGVDASFRVTTVFADDTEISSIVVVDTVHGLYTVTVKSTHMQLESTFLDETNADREATSTPIIESTRPEEDVSFGQIGTKVIDTSPLENSVSLNPPTTVDVAPTTLFDVQTLVQEIGFVTLASWTGQIDTGHQGGNLPNIPTGSYLDQEELSDLVFASFTPDLIGSLIDDDVTATAVASVTDDTYVIYKRGDAMSSRFECDVSYPVTSIGGMGSLFTTFECRFISAHTRGLVSNDTEFMDKVVDFLTIDKTKISSYRRKYESAYDGRTSARNVGILGITILATVFGGLLLLDITSFKRDIQLMITNIKS